MPDFFPHVDKVVIPDWKDSFKPKKAENRYQSPVRIRWEDESDDRLFTLPYDPVVSIEGGNNIVKRSVLKLGTAERRRGTIKELWSQQDYRITISGVLISGDGAIPADELLKLRNYCEEKRRIYVESDLMDEYGIRHIIIENWTLPHTAGIENQAYSITAVSDDDYELLIKK